MKKQTTGSIQKSNYIRQNYQEPFLNGTFTKRGHRRYKVRHGLKKYEYVDIPMSFDIETTTIVETEHSYMYIWQVGYICNNIQYVVKGRTWREFDEFIRTLSKKLGKHHIIIWDHNLPFEFMFLYGRYKNDITDMFCKEEWKPLMFTLFGNIEFRDSLALTNKSLAKLAEDYTVTQKLKGDLDYTVIRNHISPPLTEQEECYCDNDVIILCEFHQKVMELWHKNDKLPLTQTAILRQMVQQGAIEHFEGFCFGDTRKAKLTLQQTMLNKWPSEALYKLMMNYCFKGGLTHALYHIVGHTLYDLDSYDYTSDYPAIMLQDDYYFPDKFSSTTCNSWEGLEELMDHFCVMAVITFHDIRAVAGHSLISKHKAMKISGRVIEDNGKIQYAESIQLMETELDLRSYSKFYEFDKTTVEIHKVYIAKRIQLPEYLKKPVRDNYGAKARLKNADLPYANEKAIVNAAYGLTVQRLIEEEIKWDSGSFSATPAKEYEYQVAKSVLLPQWGVWITAWARYNLAMTIWNSTDRDEAGRGLHWGQSDRSAECIYYYDTDSIKCHMNDKLQTYINHWNEKRKKLNREMCDRYDLDFELYHDLGCWDHETSGHRYDRFKTLGAKRYILEKNGEFQQTIAGLGKEALIKECKGDIDKCFEKFNNRMVIYETGKLRAVRNTEEHEELVAGIRMHEYSSMALVPVEFTLSMLPAFLNLIYNYSEELKHLEKRL